MNNRRKFIVALGAGVLGAPIAFAQQQGKVWRIGYLGDGSASARASSTLEPFRKGLRDLGYVEGRNIVIDARWSEGKSERLSEFAAEFVQLKVDIIVTHGVPGSNAAKTATTSIPIVVASAADMVGSGLVASLARPGGNVTGTSDQITEISSKEVELLSELLPKLQHVGVLWNRRNPGAIRTAETVQTAARERKWRVSSLSIANPEEIEATIESAVKGSARALIVVHDPMILTHRIRIAQSALKNGLPTICASSLLAEAGGLLSYGPDLTNLFERAAIFVDRIIKGRKPADIPVEQPTKFEMVLNVKTAKALGLTIPQLILSRVDRTIE